MATRLSRFTRSGDRTLPEGIAEGAYFTDEADLFRCLSVDRSADPAATVVLEDCRTLELLVLPVEDVPSACLRVVVPGRSRRALSA